MVGLAHDSTRCHYGITVPVGDQAGLLAPNGPPGIGVVAPSFQRVSDPVLEPESHTTLPGSREPGAGSREPEASSSSLALY